MIRSGMVRFHDALEPLMVDIDSIAQAPYNYNNGDVEEIARSIETDGMYRPIYVQRETHEIIAGNHTWLACKELGSEVMPVVYLDVDDVSARRIMVKDNEIARKSKPDTGLLIAVLDEIRAESNASLEELGMGVTEEELHTLRELNKIPLDTGENDFGQWPYFTVQLHPNVLRAFRHMTKEADTDGQAFELILRLAGWDGSEA